MHASMTNTVALFLVVLLACCFYVASATSEEQPSQPRSRTWLQTAFRTVSGRGGTRGKKSGVDAITPYLQTPFGRPHMDRVIGDIEDDDYYFPLDNIGQ